MTAQLLTSELSTLLQESKRKNTDLRTVPAAMHMVFECISDLSRDLRCRPTFVKPFLLACKTRNPKFAGNAVAGLQRLIVSNALPQNTLGDVLDALRECSTLALDIQLKVLQALPSLLQNYANSFTGPLLIAAFQVCFLLYGNKTAVVSNTAAAVLQQLVSSTFEKAAPAQHAASNEDNAYEVSVGNSTVSIGGAALDAYRALDDLCLLTEGQKPKYISGASLAQNFGLELVESILVSHGDTIVAHPEQIHVLRIRLMPLIIKMLSEKTPFSTTVRAMRLAQWLVSRLLVPLASDCEIIMSLLNHMLDPEAALPWKRAMCLEVYRSLHADPSVMRTIYAHCDDAEEKRNIVRDHLGSLVRLASEKPAIIGLGHQSSIPFMATDDSSEQAALQIGGLVGSIGTAVTTMDFNMPGISNRWSTIKTPCIEQLDKSEAPALPATYIYSLALTCLTMFEDGLARFLLPFTLPVERKTKRRKTRTNREEDENPREDCLPQDEELLKSQSAQSRKVPINPLSLVEHPLYSHISTSAHMVDQCWPALLAASSTYLNATMDSDNYHTLIRSFQKFTQIAGILGQTTPRDAFLTTLGKHALPSNTSSKSFTPASTPMLSGQEFPETDNMNDSSRDVSPIPSTPSTKRRQSADLSMPTMNSRHLLCLRALLNLGIALGPVLHNSWTIIFETLQQADLILTATGPSRRKQGTVRGRESMPMTSEQPDDAEDIGLAITAAETAASRLFESTSELTDEAFSDHLECLCKLLRHDAPPEESQRTPDTMLSSSTSVRKHQKLRNVSGTSMESSITTHESSFVLDKMNHVTRSNITRLLQTETSHSGWDLFVTTLMDTVSSSDTPPNIRISAANTLDGMLVLVAVSDRLDTENKREIIRARSLSTILREINLLHKSSGQSSRSSQQCELEIHRLALEALRAILEYCGDNLTQGWNDVFVIILSAFGRGSNRGYEPSSALSGAQARSSTLVRSSFGSLQLICSDFLSSVPRLSLPQLLDTLYCFSAQDHDLNISLTTATYFRTTSDYLLRESEHIELKGISPDDVPGQLSDMSGVLLANASTQFLWLVLLSQLVKLAKDLRVEVRLSALHTIFMILDAVGNRTSPESLQTLFGVVMKPLLKTNEDQDARSFEKADKEALLTSIDTWNDTAVVIIEGLSRLFSLWLDTFKPYADLSSMLYELLDQFQVHLQRRVLVISKAVFGGISRMLAEVEDRASAGSHSISLTWGMWTSNNPASYSGTNTKGLNNNDALLAYLYCLGQLLRLGGQTLDLQEIKSTLEELRVSISQATAPAYSTDVDTLTSVQKAVLEGLKMVPVNVEGADILVVETLSSFVTMAYEQDLLELKAQQTYIALSKASMALLESFMGERPREKGRYDPSLVTAALSTLDIPLHLKYKWRRESRDPPPWKKATSTAVAILQMSMPIISRPGSAGPSFWEDTVRIVDGIIAADCSACVDKDKIFSDEGFDMEAFSTIRDMIIPSLGSESIPNSIRCQFSQSIFQNSLIHEPNPDDLAWPGEDLLEGLNREHFGRVQKLPPSPRSRMSYLLVDELFDIVAVHDRSPERTKLAQTAGPYLILRAGLTLKTYILDQPLRGRMPQPRSQKNEMLYILKKLVELKSLPEAIPPTRNFASKQTKHLHLLYPLVLKALKAAWRDEDMINALREVLEAVGEDLHLKWHHSRPNGPMSSGFVSGGTNDNPIQRDDEWLAAQHEVEANRHRKVAESRQEGGKTLYEVLQNNKGYKLPTCVNLEECFSLLLAAKQEAFEESIKLKNQFRNLEEDEVEFLDSVLESTRAKEEAVRRETTEKLDAFRRQQEETDKALREGDDEKEIEEAESPAAGESGWALRSRKRKRVKEKNGLKGLKLRKASSPTHDDLGLQKIRPHDSNPSPAPAKSSHTSPKDLKNQSKSELIIASSPSYATTIVEAPYAAAKDIQSIQKPSAGLGLTGYSSNEDN
ncbi:MAG: hypothetical protein Q9217_001577 [Psora testacea]